MAADQFAGTRFAAGDWGQGGFDGVGFYTGGSVGQAAATLTGTAAAFGDPVVATLGGQSVTLAAYGEVPGGIVLTTPDFAYFYVFVEGGFDPSHTYPISYGFGSFAAPCFAAGTRIATARGEIAVERLRLGDSVTLHAGGHAPVVWLGHRRMACRGRGADVWPVLIEADAFAPRQPRRRLRLSPDHAVFWGGGLIPVRYLLNGVTVTQKRAARAEYWHVELPRHAVLLAEGLPAESYLDAGNRARFGDLPARPIPPAEALRIWRDRACAPLWLEAAAQAPLRRHLIAQAARLGHVTTDDPALTLLADGAPLAARREGWAWHTTLPPGTRRLRLRSRSTTPAHLDPAHPDHRTLGVAVTALRLDGVALPAARAMRGWHAPEAGLRWTDGDAEVACDAQARSVEVTIAPLARYWN